jgi:hypothetical protein
MTKFRAFEKGLKPGDVYLKLENDPLDNGSVRIIEVDLKGESRYRGVVIWIRKDGELHLGEMKETLGIKIDDKNHIVLGK